MVFEFINSEYKFSLYSSLLTVDYPSSNIDINQLIEIIKFGYVKEIIQTLRETSNKKDYNLIKRKRIPCVTLSGIFNHRDSKGLIKHSGLIQIDIDQIEDYDRLFQEIVKDHYVYVCFRSPGGKGLKIIIKINPSVDTHKDQFKALEIYFKEHYGITSDSQCKDISRNMLLSFDPEIYCKPHSSVFEEIYVLAKNPITLQNKTDAFPKYKTGQKDDLIYVIESIIDQLEKGKIDITSIYLNWIKVGFALCTTFGEEGRSYYHKIGCMYPHYTPEETDKTYSQLLVKNNGKTRLATLIYLAKEFGVKIPMNNC